MTMTRRSALARFAGAVPALRLQAAPRQFEPTWESLKQYQVPKWFSDAKFGIWAHWGPQCVPETGDWYARNMYIEGSPQYEYHVQHYGHPSKVGYKDIVVEWKAEKFDAASLIRGYRKAGAKYFVSMGIHHDNFDLWNSKHHRWNAVQMGPKKDIVGLWQKAARQAGLRFGVTEHLERSWSWFNVNKGHDTKGPLAGVPYDGNDPKYADFYFPPHADNNRAFPVDPPDAWKQQWLRRITDLVDSYQPDLLYTDGGMPFGEVGRGLAAHFYNQSMQRNRGSLEAVYAVKNVPDGQHGEFQEGTCVLDLERGVVDAIRSQPWQTDTCIGNWYYKRDMQYKTAQTVVHMLVDIVSKNGNLLLNFPLLPDGTLDAQEEKVLAGITAWMAVNGEALYESRPWKIFSEGPTRTEGGMFSERNFTAYTPDDVRFTQKGKDLYAWVMGWRAGDFAIQALGLGSPQQPGKVARVEMLGVKTPLKFSQTDAALTVTFPPQKPGEIAYGLRVTLA